MSKRFTIIVGIILILSLLVFAYKVLIAVPQTELLPRNEVLGLLSLPDSPLNATYRVNDTEIKLNNGRSNAEQGELYIVGEPYYGDLTGNGHDDAVLVLVYERNIVTYYLAVALQDNRGFMGLETVPLSRGEPFSVLLENEYIALSYTPASKEQSHVEFERYIVSNTVVREVEVNDTEEVLEGSLFMSEEELHFQYCGDMGTPTVIASRSPSYAALKAIYSAQIQKQQTSAQVMIVLAGQESADDGLVISTIISVPDMFVCSNVSRVPAKLVTPLEEEVQDVVDHISPQ